MSSFHNRQELSRLSISSIKKYIQTTNPDDAFIDFLTKDSRAGVRALAQKIEKKKRRTETLLRKQKELSTIEENLYAAGNKLIAGLDEAGRGPLAGPVVAAAVILPKKLGFRGLMIPRN